MNIIINVEVSKKIGDADLCIEYILAELVKNRSSILISNQYDNSFFWVISDVDKIVYLDSIVRISKKFNDLYSKGAIYYFYIGEYSGT